MNKKLYKSISILPGYVLVIAWVSFIFVVIGWIILASFSTTPNIFQNNLFKDGFHPENYIKALVTHNVAKYFMNSVLYTITSCVGVILFAAPAAYVLSRFPFKLNKFIQKIYIMTLGVPGIMIILPLFGFITSLKMTNSRIVLIFLYIGTHIPFTLFFLMTFFKSLSFTFEEAAAIDGCSPMKTFWKIMLPLAQPGIITVSIFNFINIWNEYFMALIFANHTDLRPLAVGLFSMIQSMRYTGDWAGMFAAVVIVFLPTFILYILLSEKIISNVTGGGVKG